MTGLSLKEYRGQTKAVETEPWGTYEAATGFAGTDETEGNGLEGSCCRSSGSCLTKVTEAGLFCSRSTKVQGL